MSTPFNSPEKSPLKKEGARYADGYDASLLYPIPRKTKRDEIGIGSSLPFFGVDRWNCYEISWLNRSGKPIVATATVDIPADSPQLIESKSFKLYLNSFNQSSFNTSDDVRKTLQADLSLACGKPIQLTLSVSSQFENRSAHDWPAANLDEQDITITNYQYTLPSIKTSEKIAKERLCSHLLKSNCLVTGQPDWGSIIIEYKGPQINHADLLSYLVSFRQHNEFHEQCIERIFVDLMRLCQCEKLSVYAAYTRRGGIDICPFRSTDQSASPPKFRHFRQ